MFRPPFMVALIIAVASCSRMPPPTISALNGTWRLSEFTLTFAEPAYVPETATFTLSLQENGTASGRAACNLWRGRHAVAAGQLLIDDIASTRMRCIIEDEATARLETVYLTRLGSGMEYEVIGDSLHLKFADGLRWRFRRTERTEK